MQYYKTEDYSLANWLVFNGCILLGTVEIKGDTKKKFVFDDKGSIPELIEEWGPPLSIPQTEPARTCKKFFQAHSIIKKALRDSLDSSTINNN